MKSAAALAILLALSLHAFVDAQQTGSNTSVLPVILDPADPQAYLRGDLLLQRQLEPSIAVSTRNPQTLLAFFIDYRAVDIPNDTGLGEGTASTSAWGSLIAPVRHLLARLRGRPPAAPREQVPVAAAEAWVGMSRSYDGGLTWLGGFLPGAPFDSAPASLSSPVRGLQAATDPVVTAAPCGRFYVVFLAFTRGGASRLAVARYEDRNDREGGDPIEYLGTTVVESANNATHGYFIDKPFITVDPARGATVDPCAHNVYVSYTTFNGLEKDGKFKSKVTLARSSDRGQSFRTVKLNMPYNQNQGSTIAIDPRPGTPGTTGGGTVYLLWRHFFSPDTMLLARSTDYGGSFSRPVALTDGAPHPALQTFDQRTQSTATHAPADLAFRSNAFPTLAVSGNGTLFAAWQERVGITPGTTAFGLPAPQGSPRIVLTRSTDGGRTWSDVQGRRAQRSAIDFGDRDGDAATGSLGLLPQPRPSGPQVMPKLAFGGGRLMLLYYESRGVFERPPTERITLADLTNDAIGGLDRVLDVRAARLDPATGALVGTTQVSRYPIKADANLADGETLDDVLPVNAPCAPDYAGAPGTTPLPPCIRRINRSNVPQSAAGTAPFIGDYVEMVSALQFVPAADGRSWRWTLTPQDVPHGGFHAVFADNRNQIPPTAPAESPEWERYKLYAPPGLGVTNCINPGSRNTDVFTARINSELVVTAPTSYKQLENIQRAFPLTVFNGTGTSRTYRLRITTGAALASFSQTDPQLSEGEVEIFAYSSTTKVVYLQPAGQGRVTITVEEIAGFGGPVEPGRPTGAVSLNLDGTNPPLVNLQADADTETHNPFVQNPFVQNPFVQNPFVQNPSPSNPFVQNPFVQNPFVQNTTIYDITDVTWTVQNLGNTTASYSAIVNIDSALSFTGGANASYAFQLIVSKPSANGGVWGCDTVNELHDEILSNVVQNPFVQNPFVQNPFVQNPFVQNPFVQNPFVQNATFTVAPADGALGSGGSHDGTTHARRQPDFVNVTLRAYRLTADPPVVFDPVLSPPSLAVVAQSRNIVDGVMEEEVVIGHQSPDLVLTGTAPYVAGPLRAGRAFEFPAFTAANAGNAPASAVDGQFVHGIYLSADAFIGPDDMLLGELPAGTLAAGGQASFGPATLTIPGTVPAGTYHLGLLLDHQGEVSELNETNNSHAFPVEVLRANRAPVASSAEVSTPEDTPLAVTLTASDPDGDELTFTVVSGPSHGTLTGTAPHLTYVPAPDYFGPDAFTYSASDGELTSAAATIAITVLPVNDPPVAAPDTGTVLKNGGPLAISVLANDHDVDGGPLQIVAVSSPSTNGGLVTFSSTEVRYTPPLNFIGTDSFTYTVTDGAATAVGLVTVRVEGPGNYGFLGLLSPWTAEPVATASVGSSYALAWRYTDAAGTVIPTPAAAPAVRVRGPFTCAAGETLSTVETVAPPGSSGFQYLPDTATWQFKWQTRELQPGCYTVRVESTETRQINGPFLIQLVQ